MKFRKSSPEFTDTALNRKKNELSRTFVETN